MAFKLKSKMKFWDKTIHAHGTTMNDFFRAGVLTPRQKVEALEAERKSGFDSEEKKRTKRKTNFVERSTHVPCWVKVTFLIHQFYLSEKNKGKDYFVSTSSIQEKLKGYGNTYQIRTIQKSIAKAKALGLIRQEKFEATEAEKALHPDNDHLYAKRRKLIPNMAMIEDLISIYDEQDDIIMAHLAPKDPLKKLIRARPYSSDKTIEKKYKLYTRPGTRRKPYSDSTGMFMTWVMNVSSRYYNTESITKQFIPTTLENEQELVDEAYAVRSSDKNVLKDSDVEFLEELDLRTDTAEFFIGCYVPKEHRDTLKSIGFCIKSNGIINDWKKKSNVYTTNGFETL